MIPAFDDDFIEQPPAFCPLNNSSINSSPVNPACRTIAATVPGARSRLWYGTVV